MLTEAHLLCDFSSHRGDLAALCELIRTESELIVVIKCNQTLFLFLGFEFVAEPFQTLVKVQLGAKHVAFFAVEVHCWCSCVVLAQFYYDCILISILDQDNATQFSKQTRRDFSDKAQGETS